MSKELSKRINEAELTDETLQLESANGYKLEPVSVKIDMPTPLPVSLTIVRKSEDVKMPTPLPSSLTHFRNSDENKMLTATEATLKYLVSTLED